MTTVKALLAAGLALFSGPSSAAEASRDYQYQETKDIVALVKDAAALVEAKGEAAFPELRKEGSPWRHGSLYVFVLDADGRMLMHPDPDLEDKDQSGLKDTGGKPVSQGLIAAAGGVDGGWFHYQWPEPGKLFPTWKSVYARLAAAPSGRKYVIACGAYRMRMEKAFVVEKVDQAAALIEKDGKAAFDRLRDPAGEFRFKDTYVFVLASDGTDLVDPAFPTLEGTRLRDRKDAQGHRQIQEMIDLVRDHGSGWVDYMWPKPGDYVPMRKSSYVRKAKLGDQRVLVGCGVYLEGAAPSAGQIVALVHDAAALLKEKGAGAYPEFRKKGSRWFNGDTHLFVWNMAGKRIFHAAYPETEGQFVLDLTGIHGRPVGRMTLDAAAGPAGEGWVHYMQPKPGDIFPTWKSTFVKRVTFPNGREHLVGCGIYNMKMDEEFIANEVSGAAALIEKEGTRAFPVIRDKNGPFIFLDTYV
ncbi:MAG: cache domain-containing protein [Elusimicrobia bacterium]|nr:cache domain-containing protein [Elusimicrobiota bacterium]